jgi:nucleoid-associated protein Lsr2
MAQQKLIQLVDDLDGSSTDDIETVHFALDGADYEIDLNPDHTDALRDVFAEFISSARRTGGRVKHIRVAPRVDTSTSKGSASNREQTHAIREWARKNGHQVADRGRIPAAIVTQFNKQSDKANKRKNGK